MLRLVVIGPILLAIGALLSEMVSRLDLRTRRRRL
jgi:hypothetical protein